MVRRITRRFSSPSSLRMSCHERLVERPGELEAHGLQAAAALQHLLHVLAVVLLLLDALAVRVEVGVARHARDGELVGT